MILLNKAARKRKIKRIEEHLRNYNSYKVGIKNLKLQLDYIMPSMTASYDLVGGSNSVFNIKSDTENYAIDRIESRRALELHEDIQRYEVIINAINESLKGLDELERDFIQCRYIEGMTITKTAMELGYSEQHTFTIRNKTLNKLLISLKGIAEF